MTDPLPDDVLQQLRAGMAERRARREAIPRQDVDEAAFEAALEEKLKDQPAPLRWWVRRRVMRRFRRNRGGQNR